MRKKNIQVNEVLKVQWLLLLLLLTAACAEELPTREATSDAVPVQLSVALDHSGFSSDSEIIPMNTRAGSLPKETVVTRISRSNTLFILKELADGKWVVMEQRNDILSTPNNNVELKVGGELALNETEYVLQPGTYQFILFVNADIKEMAKHEVIDPNDALVTTSPLLRGDFFFAKATIVLKKTTGLNTKPESRQIQLSLKRNSAFIRFVIEGDGLNYTNENSTIFYKLQEKQICTGVDIFGEMMTTDTESTIEMGASILFAPRYEVGNKSWAFSHASYENRSPSLYAVIENKPINLTITHIKDGYRSYYTGPYEIKNVPVQRNHITTILIRKTGNSSIEHEINPSVKDWKDEYPPLNYVELNNK